MARGCDGQFYNVIFPPIKLKQTSFPSLFFWSLVLACSPSLQYQLTQLCSRVTKKEKDELVSIILVRVRGVTRPRNSGWDLPSPVQTAGLTQRRRLWSGWRTRSAEDRDSGSGRGLLVSRQTWRPLLPLICNILLPLSSFLKSHGRRGAARPQRHRAEAGTQSTREPSALAPWGGAGSPGKRQGPLRGEQWQWRWLQ